MSADSDLHLHRTLSIPFEVTSLTLDAISSTYQAYIVSDISL